MSMYDDLVSLHRALPPNPVAPENRNFSKLQPSAYVPRGQFYRLSDPKFIGHKPIIVIHPLDLQDMRKQLSGPFGPPSDQWIADHLEQIFAEREVRGER